jgi:TetR/AcrR family transcriptional regulator, cholesterol catabolism regulator
MDYTERILRKATEMFLTFGVKNVTMDNLAGELGISKRTLYEQFRDKDELVIQCITHMITEDNKELVEMIEQADNVVEAMILIIKRQEEKRKDFPKVFIEDIKRYYPRVNEAFYSCRETLKQFSASYTLLERGRWQGIFREDLKYDLIDNFIHEMIGLFHHSDRIKLTNPTPGDIFHNIMLPYFRGISTAKGLEMIDKYFEQLNPQEPDETH